MKAKFLFATLLELVTRPLTFDKGLGVIKNGEENDYAERVERLVENSITAKQCRKLYRQFLVGRGFAPSADGTEYNDIVVNADDGMTLFELWNDFCHEFATHGGVAGHAQPEIGGKFVKYNIPPFISVRKGAKDDRDYVGRYRLADDWPTAKKDKLTDHDPLTTKRNVLLKQIEAAGGISKYTGQIFYFNPTRFDYPLAPIHAVMNDADSEFRAGVFKNKGLRKGFFGKNILVTPPRIDPGLTAVDPKNLDKEDLLDLRHQEARRAEVDETLKSFVGVENSEGFMHLEMEFDGDDIDKALKHIQIKTDIDDKLFAHTEDSAANNIRKAYNNVPLALVESKDKSLFGKSGEVLAQAKIFYQEQTEEDRMLALKAFKKFMKAFKWPDGADASQLAVVKLVDDKPIDAKTE